MSYFQKHLKTISNENIPARPSKPRREESRPPKPRTAQGQTPMGLSGVGSSGVGMGMGMCAGQQGAEMSRQVQLLMQEADNSMEELLNSSINQFTRYLEDKDNFLEQHHQLIEQNNCLRNSLDQLKHILKSKLESALQKQKEELTIMMDDYIKLITKLLKDKEELTVNLEHLELQLKDADRRAATADRDAREARSRNEELSREKDAHIAKTKKQIDDFLQIIDQYEEEADHQGKQNEQMRARIEQLEQQLAAAGQEEADERQGGKVQTLIQLLQRAQEENRVLRDSLHSISQSDDKLSHLEADYRQRLEEMEQEHEEEFMEYEKAVRETISKKDECIERLTGIIDGYRSKRSNLECSLETTVR